MGKIQRQGQARYLPKNIENFGCVGRGVLYSPPSSFAYFFVSRELVDFQEVAALMLGHGTQAEYKSSSINPLFPEASECATKTLTVVV